MKLALIFRHIYSCFLLGLLLQDPAEALVEVCPQYLHVYRPLWRAMYWWAPNGLVLHEPLEAPLEV